MKDVKAGRLGHLRFPGDDRRRLRGRAGGPQGADPRADGQPVSLLQRPAAGARAGRPQGPADPGLALRLGGVDRPDRLLLRALGRLARAPLRGGTLAAPRSGLSRALLGIPAQVVCGAIGVFLLGVAVYTGLRGTEAPDRNFSLTFVFVTFWLGFALLSVVLRRRLRPFNPWRAIARAVGGRLPAGRRPAARRTSPIPSGSAAGRRRSGWSPSSGSSSSTAPAAASPSGSSPHAVGGRGARLHRLHAGDDGAVRGRGVVRAGRDLLRLLRDVLAARLRSRCASGRLGSAPAALGGDHAGRPCPGSVARS